MQVELAQRDGLEPEAERRKRETQAVRQLRRFQRRTVVLVDVSVDPTLRSAESGRAPFEHRPLVRGRQALGVDPGAVTGGTVTGGAVTGGAVTRTRLVAHATPQRGLHAGSRIGSGRAEVLCHGTVRGPGRIVSEHVMPCDRRLLSATRRGRVWFRRRGCSRCRVRGRRARSRVRGHGKVVVTCLVACGRGPLACGRDFGGRRPTRLRLDCVKGGCRVPPPSVQCETAVLLQRLDDVDVVRQVGEQCTHLALGHRHSRVVQLVEHPAHGCVARIARPGSVRERRDSEGAVIECLDEELVVHSQLMAPEELVETAHRPRVRRRDGEALACAGVDDVRVAVFREQPEHHAWQGERPGSEAEPRQRVTEDLCHVAPLTVDLRSTQQSMRR